MRIIDLINRKKNGEKLQKNEIDFFIAGVTDNSIPDYQISALLMAICCRGLDRDETFYLTDAMKNSGETLDLSGIKDIVCDKHSTGGVADTVTLVLAPMLASTEGLAIAKMSGRGLGHTGGTVDKLESIHNFNVNLTLDKFLSIVKKDKIAIISQLGNMCPADKKLYALRDVTGTVDSIPLIAASIMSKKLASGADNIFLDVKCGNGAFMVDLESAEKLAAEMVELGKRYGKTTTAVITDMNAPLGDYIGNKMEVYEAVEVLKGNIHNKLSKICVEIYALIATSVLNISKSDALEKGEKLLSGGEAYAKFLTLVQNQGGDINCLNADYLINTKEKTEIFSDTNGYICAINALKFGNYFVELGGGRLKKDDEIDYNVGIKINVDIGDYVKCGDLLFTVFHNGKLPTNTLPTNTNSNSTKISQLIAPPSEFFSFGKEKIAPPPLIYKIIV